MVGHLRVHTDRVFATSHAVSNDAEELRDELIAITGEWENLSRGWSGNAAAAYGGIWQEWYEGATRVVDALADSSDKLGRTAVAYDERDMSSAEVLASTSFVVEL